MNLLGLIKGFGFSDSPDKGLIRVRCKSKASKGAGGLHTCSQDLVGVRELSSHLKSLLTLSLCCYNSV